MMIETLIMSQSKFTRKILIALLAFLGLGAIGGGTALITSPSGSLMGMPLSLLGNSPFESFLFPGILLLSILGIAPIILIIALLKKQESKLAEHFNAFGDMHLAWTYSIYVPFALIFWLQIQIIYISTAIWLPYICFKRFLSSLFLCYLKFDITTKNDTKTTFNGKAFH